MLCRISTLSILLDSLVSQLIDVRLHVEPSTRSRRSYDGHWRSFDEFATLQQQQPRPSSFTFFSYIQVTLPSCLNKIAQKMPVISFALNLPNFIVQPTFFTLGCSSKEMCRCHENEQAHLRHPTFDSPTCLDHSLA